MEAWAAVACVSSVVQLVDFTARCISKTSELCRSSDGVLKSNSAIKDVTNRLDHLTKEVETTLSGTNDLELGSLCAGVRNAAGQLLEALTKLEVEGNKTTWKSLRKAIRSIWSNEQILDLQRQLNRFRDQLNLYITVRIRQQIISFRLDTSAHFAAADQNTQEVLRAILSCKDVFEAKLQHLELLDAASHTETRTIIQRNHLATTQIIQSTIDSGVSVSATQHDQTREAISRRLSKTEGLSRAQIETTTTEIINVIHDSQLSDARAHAHTQAQIDELQRAIQLLGDQIAERNKELESLIALCSQTRNAKKREKISERSTAVTAALLALETMYRSLQAVLTSMQNAASEFLASSETWSVTKYARQVYQSSSLLDRTTKTPKANRGHASGTTMRSHWDMHHADTSDAYFAHELYVNYSYPWIPLGQDVIFVDLQFLNNRWTLDPSKCPEGFGPSSLLDSKPCNSSIVWLLAATSTALQMHLQSFDQALSIIGGVFDANDRRLEDDGVLTVGLDWRRARLQTDLTLWEAFADNRKMAVQKPRKIFTSDEITDSQRIEVEVLLFWLIGVSSRAMIGPPSARIQGPSDSRICIQVTSDGVAHHISQSLLSMGLNIDISSPIPRSSRSDKALANVESIGVKPGGPPLEAHLTPITTHSADTMVAVSVAGHDISLLEHTFEQDQRVTAFRQRMEAASCRFARVHTNDSNDSIDSGVIHR